MIKKVTVSHEIEIKIIDDRRLNRALHSYRDQVDGDADLDLFLTEIAHNYSMYCHTSKFDCLEKTSDNWFGIEIKKHELKIK